MAQALDTTSWTVMQTPDGNWRHVNHDLKLATSGWGTREAAEKPMNANGYIDTVHSRTKMAIRYRELVEFPAQVHQERQQFAISMAGSVHTTWSE